MADAVTTKTVWENDSHIKVHCTCISDGTGETDVVKVDKSALVAPDGAEPASLEIEELRWNVQGFSSVRIEWDYTTDEVAAVLSGNGYDDFRGRFEEKCETGGLLAGDGAGGTGDIVVTTAGAVSGATYDFTILVKKASD
jgi:hypothetical protein